MHGPSPARFALLHRDGPGVLARVDALVGEHGLDVDGQVLAASGELGYVVTDVNDDIPSALLTSLRALPETLWLMTFPTSDGVTSLRRHAVRARRLNDPLWVDGAPTLPDWSPPDVDPCRSRAGRSRDTGSIPQPR